MSSSLLRVNSEFQENQWTIPLLSLKAFQRSRRPFALNAVILAGPSSHSSKEEMEQPFRRGSKNPQRQFACTPYRMAVKTRTRSLTYDGWYVFPFSNPIKSRLLPLRVTLKRFGRFKLSVSDNRGERIWTSDPLVPNQFRAAYLAGSSLFWSVSMVLNSPDFGKIVR